MSGNTDVNKVALPAGEFENVFRDAGVLTDALNNAKSAKSKSTQMGRFLATNVDREVSINANGRTGKAKLCMSQGRAKQKLYYFEVWWDDLNVAAEPQAPEGCDKAKDGMDASGATSASGDSSASNAGGGEGSVKKADDSGNREPW